MSAAEPTSENWDSVFDTLQTLGRIAGLWLPTNIVIAGTLEAVGLLRRHLPRLLAQLSRQPAASAEIQRDLRTMESQVTQEGRVSDELVARLQAQTRQLTALDGTPAAPRGPMPDADDLARFFETGESTDVNELSLKLQNAEALRAVRAQWLAPSTLLLGGAFHGEVHLAQLLPGSGWREQVRSYIYSVQSNDSGAVRLVLDDRAHLAAGGGETLLLAGVTTPAVVLDRDGVSRCRVVPLELPNPVRLVSGRSELSFPRQAVAGWGVRLGSASESNDGLTIFHLQPQTP